MHWFIHLCNYRLHRRTEKGINSFLEDNLYRDKIVVVQQNGAGGQSWVRSILDNGETYTQSNWAETGTCVINFIISIPKSNIKFVRCLSHTFTSSS